MTRGWMVGMAIGASALAGLSAATAAPAPPWSETVPDPTAYDLTVTEFPQGPYYGYQWDVTFWGTDLLQGDREKQWMHSFVVYDDQAQLIGAVDPSKPAQQYDWWRPNAPSFVAVEWRSKNGKNRVPYGGSISFKAWFDRPLADPYYHTAIQIQSNPDSLWVNPTPELSTVWLLLFSGAAGGLLKRRRNKRGSGRPKA